MTTTTCNAGTTKRDVYDYRKLSTLMPRCCQQSLDYKSKKPLVYNKQETRCCR